MKKNKLISIIIPVYNTEKYIDKCLDSVLKAKTPECEVIIINDGSKDDCESKIKAFMKNLPADVKDDFKYIYKDNKGLADTKNVGIKEATGEFISVVDSDDYIDPGFYKYAIPYLNDYDVIIYDLYVIFENPKGDEFDYVARAFDDRYHNNINQYLSGQMQGSSCNKIIKKDLYTLEFPVGKQYEDVAVTPFILMNTEKIKYLPYAMYYYLQRANSIVNNNTLYSAYYKICSNIQDVLDTEEKMDRYKEVIDMYFINRTIPNLELNYKKDKKSMLNNLEDLSNNAELIIKYINKTKLVDNSFYSLTNNQKRVLRSIFENLEKKNYRGVCNVFLIRGIINYVRGIVHTFVAFLKSFVGA